MTPIRTGRSMKPLQRDAAAARLDEGEELLDFGVVGQRPPRLLQRLAHIQRGAEEEAVDPLQRTPDLHREAATLQSDAVEAVESDGVARSTHERRDILVHP